MVFGSIAASIGLLNISLGKLTELVTHVKCYKQLRKDTRKAIELLTELQDGDRAPVLNSDTLESMILEVLEINSKLNKLMKKCQARWYTLKTLTIFITATFLMGKLGKILGNVENLRGRLETCEMITKSTEVMVRDVANLKQELARGAVQ